MGLKQRLAPLIARLSGKAPLCPWKSIIKNYHLGTFGVMPPAMDIQVIRSLGDRHLLRFDQRDEFWFPRTMLPTRELWSEYLVTTWNHRCNAHGYLNGGVHLNSNDIALDCGACEGFFARRALDLGVKRVICVEPNVEMAACLEATFSAEIDAGRLLVLPLALGSHSGKANFSTSPGDAFSGRFDATGTDQVSVTTLDQLTVEHGRPSMIKMDLEGNEYEALRGGFDLLTRYRPMLAITTYHYPWDYAVVSNFLRGIGYRNTLTSSATMRCGSIPRPVMMHAWD